MMRFAEREGGAKELHCLHLDTQQGCIATSNLNEHNQEKKGEEEVGNCPYNV